MVKKVFKGGNIITMDPHIGDLEKGDILVEGSKIIDIQREIHIDDKECEIIDATDMIILPGFIDTHRHTWESLIRNIGADWSLQTYLSSIYYGNIGSLRSPDDDYIGNLIGALEALEAGVTTILDWTMIISQDHTDELIRGLQESGIRAVFAHGSPGEGTFWDRESERVNLEQARYTKKTHFSSNDQLITMGLAIRGPEFSAWEATVKEIELARELDAICSMHLGFGTWGAQDRSIEKLNRAGLLGKDLNFTHANAVSPEEIKMLVEKGGSVSVTPEVEMMMGHGYPATGLCLENGLNPALGVDVVTSTAGDMFAQMKFALQAERARVNQKILDEGNMPGPELSISARKMLELATIEGAKTLDLDDKVGSLTPGKEADIVMIRTSDLNLFPINDPVGAVVQTCHAGNVDSVFVGGKPIKREGKMLNIDITGLKKQAIEARDAIMSRYQR
ncbi:amidohydrolase family protein [Salipaludibacillus agaradhaerens]|uniref:Amidohydrolase family protein n=1 Tax=Salipaludibacillus agaradhaerens TaxID=76935 RepID=A0A9Q4AZ37_SALAG|nr:amidohydrolase family protein [Salipaludibacillus agaradhaerens]MCR6095309.1 amidohydrolase family protein [Salipaludibacillus agaradhaerens]MCR6115133.1 amidohydrolase family protein [Salipaludibacillus agaradhaerens]